MAELQPVAGQLVCVATPRLGGGEPMLAVHIVGERNPNEAEEIIKDRIGPDEQVTGMRPLPPSALMAFRLKPGQFTFWRHLAMMKHPKRPRDAAQLAKLIIDIATGEASPHPAPPRRPRWIAERRLCHTNSDEACVATNRDAQSAAQVSGSTRH